MVVNFNEPVQTTDHLYVLDQLRENIIAALCLLEVGTAQNIPQKAKRYNPTSGKLEMRDGDAWVPLGFQQVIDAHIGNTAIHGSLPVGTILMWAGTTLPEGFLWCTGQVLSITAYQSLYNVIGDRFATSNDQPVGPGQFKLPDFRQRHPIGVDSGFSTLNLPGKNGGSFNHFHSTPAHRHTVENHAHYVATHYHTVPAHNHGIPSHTHQLPQHYHSVKDNFGSNTPISITNPTGSTNAGFHKHSMRMVSPSLAEYTGANPRYYPVYKKVNPSTTGIDTTPAPANFIDIAIENIDPDNNSGKHVHETAVFSGIVGRGAGANGDNNMDSGPPLVSGGAALTSTSNSGAIDTTNSGAGWTTYTAPQTDESGAGVSGTANPAYLAVNFMIKY